MSDYATTGDGVLTGIQLAAEVARRFQTSELVTACSPPRSA